MLQKEVNAFWKAVLLIIFYFFTDPSDVADGTLYLLSDMAKMVNGTALNVDGGMACN